MKRIIRLLAIYIVCSALLVQVPVVRAEEDISIPILMYHNITGDGKRGDGLNVPVDRFEEQIRYLKYHGYNTISFEQLYDYLKGEDTLPPNPIIITFDDGYVSNYSYAYPLLKKYGYCAAVFVITGYIGEEGYMTAQMLKEIQSDGVFDVQSHSVNHSYSLSREDVREMVYQVRESRRILEELLGKPVTVFCYPYGRYSSRLMEVLRDEGYVMAVTTSYGVVSKDTPTMLLRRLRVFGYDTGNSLKGRIERNTGKATRPVFDDVKQEDPHLLLFIKGIKKGWIGTSGRHIFPEGVVNIENFAEGLSRVVGETIQIKEPALAPLTINDALKIIRENTYLPNIEGVAGLHEKLLKGIDRETGDSPLTRRQMLILLSNLEEYIHQAREAYRDKPLGTVSAVTGKSNVFIIGNYYAADKGAPRDIFAVDIDEGLLKRVTYFNDIGCYRQDILDIRISPDGKRIGALILDLNSGGQSVIVIDVVGGNAVSIKELQGQDRLIGFHWLDCNTLMLHIGCKGQEWIELYDPAANLIDIKKIN